MRTKLDELEDLAERESVQIAICKSWVDSFQDLFKELKEVDRFSVKGWRKERDVVSKGLRACGLPAALAKASADQIYATATADSKEAVEQCRHIVQLPAQLTKADFSKPVFFLKSCESSHVHRALNKRFNGYKDVIVKEAEPTITGMIATKSPAHHMTTDGIPAGFDWNDCGEVTNEWCSPIGGVKPVLHIIRNVTLDGRLSSNPWTGQRQVFQCMQGHLSVTVANGVELAKHGCITTFLKTAHYDFFKNDLTFNLEPGDSLYLPLGTKALTIGVPTTAEKIADLSKPDKAKQNANFGPCDFAIYVVYLLFDERFDHGMDEPTRAYALSQWTAALGRIPSSVRDLAGAWAESLKPPTFDEGQKKRA